MKVDVQEMEPCRVTMTVKAEAEEIRPDYDAVVRYFVQKGRVPGFRAGKVPLEVIKRTFSNEIREEVNSRLMHSLYAKAVKQAELKVVNLVDIRDMKVSPETGVTVTFVVDVEPTIAVPDYKAFPVKFVAPEVPEDVVNAQIERIREAFAHFDAADADYAVARDDLACIDFEGKVNDQPIQEVVSEAIAIAAGAAHWTQVNDERFFPSLVAGLVGMKAGETKTVAFTFEGDYLPDALKGQPAEYVLAVKEVRRRVLPTDAELVQQVKTADMEAFRALTRDNLTGRAALEATRNFESEIIAHLLGKREFDLPQMQLEEEINETLHRMAEEAGRRGMTKEDMERRRAEIVESATAMAKRQLRTRYVLAAVADAEKIEATDEDVGKWIEEAAPGYRESPIKLRARIEKNGRMADLRQQVRTRKVLTHLVDMLK